MGLIANNRQLTSKFVNFAVPIQSSWDMCRDDSSLIRRTEIWIWAHVDSQIRKNVCIPLLSPLGNPLLTPSQPAPPDAAPSGYNNPRWTHAVLPQSGRRWSQSNHGPWYSLYRPTRCYLGNIKGFLVDSLSFFTMAEMIFTVIITVIRRRKVI